jgi:CDP-diacylglycerol---serine O-phosphatidyltransferase
VRVNLRKSLFLLPNLITLSSVFCGFYAIILSGQGASEQDFYGAALLIVYAMFFDTLDGRVARLTKTQSALGVQLDSLADVISFGVAPAALVYRWSLESLGGLGLAACFAFVACGVLRLARFNVLTMGESGAPKKPGKYIIGLPIPGAAGIVVSLVVANHSSVSARIPQLSLFVLAVVVVLSLCMVSTIRFRSFKDMRLNLPTALFVAFGVGSTAFIAVRFEPAFALVWLLTSYVVIGLAEAIFGLSARTFVLLARPKARIERRGRRVARESEAPSPSNV